MAKACRKKPAPRNTAKNTQTTKTRNRWRTTFLHCLAETSNVSEAARQAGVNASRAYKTRRENPGFAQKWRKALCDGYEHLELELLYRLRTGEPKDGPKYDNASALRLLALHRDTVAQEQAQRRNMDAASARAIIDAKLEELRQRVIARRAAEGKAQP